MNDRLESIKTYLLVAFVFAILAVASDCVGLVFLSGVVSFFGILTASVAGAASSNPFAQSSGPVLAAATAPFIVYLIFSLLFWGTCLTMSLLCLARTNKLRRAAQAGDIARLKTLSSVGWGVVGIFFMWIIGGVMLLIANSEIQQLRMSGPGGLSADDMATLVKWKSLLDSGIVSKSEFDAQKAKLLGGKASAPDESEELKQLKALRESGALTQEEFDAQKARFLSHN